MKETQLGQPGLFVSFRPNLTLILLISVLGVIGFSGGVLANDPVRAAIGRALWDFILISIATMLCLIVPVIAPQKFRWWSTGLSILALVGVAVYAVLFEDALSSANATGFIFYAGTLMIILMFFLTPVLGRFISLSLMQAPFFGFFAVTTVMGYIYRQDGSDSTLLAMLLALGICAGLTLSVQLEYRRAALLRQKKTAEDAAGRALNSLIPLGVFAVLAVALLVFVYVRSMGDVVRWPGALAAGMITAIAIATSLVCLAAVGSFGGLKDRLIESEANRLQNMDDAFGRLSKAVTPVMYGAALSSICLVAITLFVETPIRAYIGDFPDAAARSWIDWINPTSKVLFYICLTFLAAAIFSSLRIAVLIVATFFLSDVLSTALMAGAILKGPGAASIIDVLPRIITLILICGTAQSWRHALRDTDRRRFLVVRSFRLHAAPYLLGLILSLLVICWFGLLVEANATWTKFVFIRLSLQGVLAFAILPPMMMAVGRLSFVD